MSGDIIIDISSSNADSATIDLGSCAYANGQRNQINFRLLNANENQEIVILDIEVTTTLPEADFPAMIEFETIPSDSYEKFPIRTSIQEALTASSTSNMPAIVDMNTNVDIGKAISFPVNLSPHSSCPCALIFTPIVPPKDYDHPRTSYFNIFTTAMISYQLVDRFTREISAIQMKPVSIMATLCMSLLYLDETELDFGDCTIGDTCHRTIQIWNRSECPLEYMIVYDTNTTSHHHNDSISIGDLHQHPDNMQITIVSTDNGKMVYPSTLATSLPIFAAQKLKLSVKAKIPGHYSVKFRVENTSNPQNITYINCKFNAIDKDHAVDTVRLVETLDAEPMRSYKISLGNCFFNRLQVRKFFIVNSSNRDAPVKLSTDVSTEVFFHIMNPTSTSLNVDDMCDNIDAEFPKRIYQIFEKQRKTKPLGSFAMTRQALIDLESREPLTEDMSNTAILSSSDINLNSSINLPESPPWKDSSINVKQEKLHLPRQPHQRESMSSNNPISSYNNKNHQSNKLDVARICATLYAEDNGQRDAMINYEQYADNVNAENLYLDIWCKRQLHPANRRRFVGISSQCNGMKASPLKGLGSKDHIVTASPLLSSHRKPLLSHYDYRRPDISCDPHIESIIPANSHTIVYVFYTPTIASTTPSDNMTIPIPSSTALSSKSFKLSLSWQEVIDNHHHNTVLSKFYTFENRSWKHRSYSCKSMCCVSYITISQLYHDLKDCSVGEFYYSSFAITNHSELETRIIPYMESDTLSLPSNQVLVIPPKETIKLRFDYVAQLENTDYHRRIIILNENNSCNHHMVEVRARNIDTQQVLQHSLYYKIFTGNHKQHLQVYYDVCMLNMVNVRTFRIRNVSLQPIHLQIAPHDEKYEGEVLILALKSDSSLHANKADYTSINNPGLSLEDLKWNGLKASSSLLSQLATASTTDDIISRPIKARRGSYGAESIAVHPHTTCNTPSHDSGKYSRSYSVTSSISDIHSLLNNSSKINKVKSSDAVNDMDTIPGNQPHHSDSKADMMHQTPPRHHHDEHVVDADQLALLSSIHKMKVDGYPFSYMSHQLSTLSSSNTQHKTETSSVESQLDTTIRAVQKAIQDINKLCTSTMPSIENVSSFANSSSVVMKLSSQKIFTVPAGTNQSFAIIFSPRSVDSSNNRNEDPDLNFTTINRLLEIKLLSNPTSMDSSSASASTYDVFGDDLHLHDLMPSIPSELKPRYLTIRAKVCRSEMSVLQRNINFGKLYIGETSMKSVTITNQSAVPLLYGITKSGSISSGFLRIPSGRRGQILSKSSATISFVLKPSLAGNFEETIEIYNVLNPHNTKSLVVKAKVMKPEVFTVTMMKIDEVSQPANALVEEVYQSEHTSIKESSSSLSLPSFPTLLPPSTSLPPSSANVIGIGDGAVGQECEHELAFQIKNVSNRKRQLIIDANHIDAVILSANPSTHGEEYLHNASIFDNDMITHESIVNLRCKFDIIENAAIHVVKLSEDEKISLSDKLEKFSQKLKIAYRKNKSEKITKYEKKVRQVQDALTGNTGLPIDEDDDEEGDNIAVLNNKNPQNKASSVMIEPPPTRSPSQLPHMNVLASSDVSLHFDLEPDIDVTVRVRVTFIPGSSYRKWSGKLNFHGNLRVFEIRNEDHVKLVPFTVNLYSSLKSHLSALKLSSQATISIPVELDNEENTPLNSLIFPHMKLLSENITRFRAASEVMLTTVSQWSSYPTKILFPDYRHRKQNILGMSVKLVQMSKDGIMQGCFSVDSLLSRGISVSFQLIEKWTYDASISLGDEVEYYDSGKHGKISFTIESLSESETVQYGHEIVDLRVPSGGRLDCLLQYQPDKNLYKTTKSIIGCICIQVHVREDTVSIQYIPLVCFLERKSSFNIQDKYVNFGEVHAFSSKLATATITNTSDEDLHYFTSLIYSTSIHASSMPSIGRAVLKSGHTGVIPVQTKKELTVKLLTNSKAGRFEQDLWILNLTNRSDQKKITLLASVIINPTNYITFLNVPLKSGSTTYEYERLQFGSIQLPKDASYSPPIKYHYTLQMQNISAVNLYITATSNLKNQCFIYADDACTIPVTMLFFEASATISLYIVIRPSSSSTSRNHHPTSNSNSSEAATKLPSMKSKPSLLHGRELVGGIRFEYFIDSQIHGSGSFSSPNASSHSIIHSNTLETFFEVTLDFIANVGQSQLHIIPTTALSPFATASAAVVTSDDLPPSMVKKVRFDPTSPSTSISSKYRIISSAFAVENKSSIFPLSYEFIDTSCRIIHVPLSQPLISTLSDDMRISLILDDIGTSRPTSIPMIFIFIQEEEINDKQRVSFRLGPNQESNIHYYIFYDKEKVSGLVKYLIKMRNIDTGDVQLYQNSIFVDPGYVSSLPEPLTNTTSLSQSDHDNIILVSLKEDADKMHQIEVIGATKRVLCSYIIQNTSSSPITVTPVSNIPITITIADKQSDENHNHLDSSSQQVRQLQHRIVRREDPTHRSLLTLSSGHWKHGLYKSGDSVTIHQHAQAIMTIASHHGANISQEYMTNDKQAGMYRHLSESCCHKGTAYVALVHSNQALSSFFAPAPQHAIKSNLLSLFQQPSSTSSSSPPIASSQSNIEVVEVISLTTIDVKFVVPKVKVVSDVISLGQLRCRRSLEFSCEVQNICDVEVPVILEGLPSWISTPSSSAKSALSTLPKLTLTRRRTDSTQDDNQPRSKASATSPGVSSTSTGRIKHNLGAQKLQLWLENKSLANQSDTNRSRKPSYDDNMNDSDVSDDVYSSSGLDSIAESEGSSIVENNSVNLLHNHYDNDTLSYIHHQNAGINMHINGTAGEDLEQLSMQVAHMSMAIDSPHRVGAAKLSIEDIYEFNHDAVSRSVLTDEQHHQAVVKASLPSSLTSPVIYFIPPRSTYAIKLIATAPRVESQTLSHTIHVKNIASSLISGDIHDVKVTLAVDSSKLLQLSSSVGQTLSVSGPKSTPYINMNRSISVPCSKRPAASSYSNLPSDYDDSYAMAMMCVKNLYSVTVRVLSLAVLSDRLSRLIDCHMILPTSRTQPSSAIDNPISCDDVDFNSTRRCAFELMPGEEMEVRVYYRGKASARINNIDRDIISLLFNSSHRGLLEAVDHDDNNNVDEILYEEDDEEADDDMIMEDKRSEQYTFGDDEDYGSDQDSLMMESRSNTTSRYRSDSTTLKHFMVPSSKASVDGNNSVTSSDHRLLHHHATTSPKNIVATSSSPITIPYSSSSTSLSSSTTMAVSGAEVGKPHSYVQPDGYGPLLIGRMLFKAQELSGESSPDIPLLDVTRIWSMESTTDTIIADVIGFIQPHTIFSIHPIVTTETTSHDIISELDYECVLVNDGSIIPTLIPKQATYKFILTNESSSPCRFHVQLPQSFRHPNLRMMLVDREWENIHQHNDDQLYDGMLVGYDSFKFIAYPSRDVIPAFSSIEISLELVPNLPADAIILSSTLPPNPPTGMLGRAVINIIEDTSSSAASVSTVSPAIHPSLSFHVNISADVDIPIISSAPVSMINRSKQHLGESVISPATSSSSSTQHVHRKSMDDSSAMVVNENNTMATKPSTSSLSSSSTTTSTYTNPMLRIRGATPSPFPYKRIYDINLGQQSQKNQHVEWLITIENRSSTTSLEFIITLASSSLHHKHYHDDKDLHQHNEKHHDLPFLQVGQQRGYVKQSDSIAVMLYCYRQSLGQHSDYLMIENITCPGDIHVLCVTMDVIPSASLTTSTTSPTISSISAPPSDTMTACTSTAFEYEDDLHRHIPAIIDGMLILSSLSSTPEMIWNYDSSSHINTLTVNQHHSSIDIIVALPSHSSIANIIENDDSLVLISYSFNLHSSISSSHDLSSCDASYTCSDIIQDYESCRLMMESNQPTSPQRMIAHKFDRRDRQATLSYNVLSSSSNDDQSNKSNQKQCGELIIFYLISCKLNTSTDPIILSKAYLQVDFNHNDHVPSSNVISPPSSPSSHSPTIPTDMMHAAVQTFICKFMMIMNATKQPPSTLPINLHLQLDVYTHYHGIVDHLLINYIHHHTCSHIAIRGKQLLQLIITCIMRYADTLTCTNHDPLSPLYQLLQDTMHLQEQLMMK